MPVTSYDQIYVLKSVFDVKLCHFVWIHSQDAVLNTLEKKVKEQDAYWRDIVQLKDNEIRSLQSSDVAST